MVCFVVTQHSESELSLCLRYSKTSSLQATKKSTEHTDDTESRNKQPRAGSPTVSLAQGDALRTQQNILQSSCKDKSKNPCDLYIRSAFMDSKVSLGDIL